MNLTFSIAKGFEDLAENELYEFGVNIITTEVKQIHGEYKDEITKLQELKTVDDVLIKIADSEGDQNIRLEELLGRINSIDFIRYMNILSSFRELNGTFSLTISKYKSKINLEELKSQLNLSLAKKLQLKYTPKLHENFDIRISINEDSYYIGIRLFQKPLHQRYYVNENYLGTLKPTIAALLCRATFSKHKSGQINIVDNFCGSGTILCEGYLQGANVFGGDINSNGVTISKKRLSHIGTKNINVFTQSAFTTSWRSKSFNTVISNLPWNEQLEVKNISELYEKSIQEYRRIVTDDAVLCFIVKKPDLLIKNIMKNFPKHRIETRKISFNGQQPAVIITYIDK